MGDDKAERPANGSGRARSGPGRSRLAPILGLLLYYMVAGQPALQPALASEPFPTVPAGGGQGMRASDEMGASLDHGIWAELLDRYRRPPAGDGAPALIDYAALRAAGADRARLDAYIEALAAIRPGRLADKDRFAYWVNLYNALTVKVIVDHYPVASIRKINISPGLFSTGPWGAALVTVDGRALSLDNIEHDILRAEWRDPRVHYAVNCASIGCPDIAARPYDGARLDEMLDAAARTYINSPRGARIERGHLIVSRIFDWYARDFGTTDAEIIDHIRGYADAQLKQRLAQVKRISRYEYDWSLNDAAE